MYLCLSTNKIYIMKTILISCFILVSYLSIGQERIFNFSEKNGLWGFVKADGTVILPGTYKAVSYFSADGYATAFDYTAKEAILINSKGEKVALDIKGLTDLEYIGETEKNLEKKLLIAKTGKMVGVINIKGKTIHPFQYEKITYSGNQFMVGKKGTTFSILNIDGTVIELPGIIDVRDLKEGLAPYRATNKLFGFIDSKGKIVIEAKYSSVGYFSGGLAWVKNENNLVGFIDKTGKSVIDVTYDMVKEFDPVAKRALAKKGDIYLYLTPTGQEIKVEDATKLGNFTNGYAYAFKGELVGFIDPNGKWIVEPQFQKVHDFSEGFARVKKNNLWGYINTKGEMVIEAQFEDVDDIKGGYACVKQKGLWGVIDSKGNFTLQPKYLKLK